MKLNVVTLCSGYDSQFLALDQIKNQHPDFDYDLIAWCEIDKYAIQGHNLLFPQYADRNLGDMTKVDWLSLGKIEGGIDLLTYSTPCQDISQAGKQRGFDEGSDTRSGILWHTEKAIRDLRPKYLMQENVKAIVSKKFMPMFQSWCDRVESYGYKNYWAVMNAKDYGVPQNRERMFMISIRDDIANRYQFHKPFPLERVLADILEQEVDESYYLSDKAVDGFLRNSSEFTNNHDFSDNPKKSADAPDEEKDANGLPIHVTAPSGNIYDLTYEDDQPKWIRYETDDNGVQHKYGIRFRIRKLTPRECFRLMDVQDNRIDQLMTTEIVPAKKGSTDMVERLVISKSQLYKMAGNSIVVGCMVHIFNNLFYPEYDATIETRTDNRGQGLLEFEF